MPPVTRIQKQDILEAAYQIARIDGLEAVNARAIAKRLNCSIQPIFHKFSNMQELKNELLEKIINTYRQYMTEGINKEHKYKQMGLGYIKFAKDEPKLFKIIFMTETKLSPENFVTYDKSFTDIEKYAGIATQLNSEETKKFHIKMWIFTHGIATLVANNTCKFSDEQISNLLTEEFNALMKLQEFKGEMSNETNATNKRPN